jgi:PKD repeat protein
MQEDPPWHLDRIDQRALPEGHPDRGEEEGEDCRRSGHGTSVAALAGGNTVGVARAVELVSVRMFGCEDPSPSSRTIAAVDWVTADHEKPAVANMSLGSSSEALDDAVRNSIAAGVTYMVSAGNRGTDRPPRLQLACNQSPARVREALTVAATDHLDRKPSWSSYGECVDLFAPGEEITTAIRTADDAYRVDRWGTSFSAPLVAGVAALYLQEEPTALPAQVFAAVIDATTKNIVSSAGSGTSNNHLLFSLAWGDAVEPPPPPPPPPPPAAPSDLAATAISANQIDLAWTDNSDDEDGFRIERCTGAECVDFAHIAGVGQNVNAYSDGGLAAETTYRYRVAAFNDGGDSDWSNEAEAITPPPPDNQWPVASFTYACAYLACTFTDTSTDDGEVVAWSWTFGDGATSSARHPSHTYTAAATYTVTLTVTDNNGATGVASEQVTVTAPPPASTVKVGSIVYSTHGGRNNNQHLTVTLTVVDTGDAPVAGAVVSFTLLNTTTDRIWNSTATTGSNGQVSLNVNNAPNGTYTTTVNSITASGMEWDGITPTNSFTK